MNKEMKSYTTTMSSPKLIDVTLYRRVHARSLHKPIIKPTMCNV